MTNEADFEELNDELTPQERLFVEAYGNPESETFGNATKSAAAAKYSQPHNAGWKLKKRPHIQAALEAMHEDAAKDVGQVLADLRNLHRLAMDKGDLSSAAQHLGDRSSATGTTERAFRDYAGRGSKAARNERS